MDRQDADYEHDVYAWTQAQGAAIRRAGASRVTADVDWELAAEEIESLGRSDRDTLESHLQTVIEHLLKLMPSPATDPRDGWERNVLDGRFVLARKLSTTLRAHPAATFGDRYRHGRRLALNGLKRDGLTAADLPEHCPRTLDELLDEEFWPENRHGLP